MSPNALSVDGRYTLGVLAAIQILIAVSPTTHAYVEVSCLNGSVIHITARYYGNATAFYVTSDNSSGCHGYQVAVGEWYIEHLLRPECASQLLEVGGGWWTGTLRAQVGGVPSSQDLNHTYYCPAAYYSSHKYTSVRSLVHHAGPQTKGNISLRFVGTRGHDLSKVWLGEVVRLQVDYLPLPTEGHSFTVVNCRAGNIFPSPNASYDIIVDGCGDGEVIPKFRGFLTSQVAGGTSLTGVSTPFRAFQISHYDVMQVMCSYVVCPNTTDCDGDSCKLLKRRQKRQLPPYDKVYETTSPPIKLALNQDLTFMYEAKEVYEPSAADKRPPASSAKDEALYTAYVATDSKSGNVNDETKEDDVPYYDYDAGFDGQYEDTGTSMAQDETQGDQTGYNASESIQMMELTVIIVIAVIMVGLLLIIVITCAICMVFRVSEEEKDKQPLLMGQIPYHQNLIPVQSPYYQEQPRFIFQEELIELRRGVTGIDTDVDSEQGGLLDISQVSALFAMDNAPQAQPTDTAHAEVHGAPRVRSVHTQTTLSIDETTNEEPSTGRTTDVSPGAGSSTPIVVADDSMISLPNFNPWLIHLESGVDLGILTPLFSLPRHRASAFSPKLEPLTLCFDSDATTRSLYSDQNTGQSTPRSPRYDSRITIPEAAESNTLGDSTLVFSDSSPNNCITLELTDNTIEIEDDQLPYANSRILDHPIQWPGIHYPIASTSQNQQYRSSPKAFLADGTKCQLVSGKAILQNRINAEVPNHQPGSVLCPGPSKTAETILRNRTFCVPLGEHAPLFNLPVIKPEVQPEEQVSEPDVTLTRRYVFPSPETFPVPAPKKNKKPVKEPLMDVTMNPLVPLSNTRQTRRPPIPGCFMQATADCQRKEEKLDGQITSHDQVEVVDMQESIRDDPDNDITDSLAIESDSLVLEATSDERIPLLFDIADDLQSESIISGNEANLNTEDTDTDQLVDTIFSAAFLY